MHPVLLCFRSAISLRVTLYGLACNAYYNRGVKLLSPISEAMTSARCKNSGLGKQANEWKVKVSCHVRTVPRMSKNNNSVKKKDFTRDV